MKRTGVVLLLAIWLLMAAAFFSGCTDAERAQFRAFGDPALVTCYSGGKVIYEGQSSGKVLTIVDSDGWFFNDASTGRLVRVSGACVIRN